MSCLSACSCTNDVVDLNARRKQLNDSKSGNSDPISSLPLQQHARFIELQIVIRCIKQPLLIARITTKLREARGIRCTTTLSAEHFSALEEAIRYACRDVHLDKIDELCRKCEILKKLDGRRVALVYGRTCR